MEKTGRILDSINGGQSAPAEAHFAHPIHEKAILAGGISPVLIVLPLMNTRPTLS
jgi:hypothetical protein